MNGLIRKYQRTSNGQWWNPNCERNKY